MNYGSYCLKYFIPDQKWCTSLYVSVNANICHIYQCMRGEVGASLSISSVCTIVIQLVHLMFCNRLFRNHTNTSAIVNQRMILISNRNMREGCKVVLDAFLQSYFVTIIDIIRST